MGVDVPNPHIVQSSTILLVFVFKLISVNIYVSGILEALKVGCENMQYRVRWILKVTLSDVQICSTISL